MRLDFPFFLADYQMRDMPGQVQASAVRVPDVRIYTYRLPVPGLAQRDLGRRVFTRSKLSFLACRSGSCVVLCLLVSMGSTLMLRGWFEVVFGEGRLRALPGGQKQSRRHQVRFLSWHPVKATLSTPRPSFVFLMPRHPCFSFLGLVLQQLLGCQFSQPSWSTCVMGTRRRVQFTVFKCCSVNTSNSSRGCATQLGGLLRGALHRARN